MIMVEGWVRFAEGEVEKLRGAATTMMAATRAEAGCLHYAFAADMAEPDLMRISERWVDEAAIGAHMKTPHMAAFNGAIGGAKILGVSVKSYEASFLRTLMGE